VCVYGALSAISIATKINKQGGLRHFLPNPLQGGGARLLKGGASLPLIRLGGPGPPP